MRYSGFALATDAYSVVRITYPEEIMTEPSISKAIDKAAKANAQQIIATIAAALSNALKPHWRPKLAGEEHIGDDIRKLLKALADSETDWRAAAYQFQPSSKMIDHCRASLVNDLLKGLPRLRELALLAESTEVDAETTKFFNDRHDARVAAGNEPLHGE